MILAWWVNQQNWGYSGIEWDICGAPQSAKLVYNSKNGGEYKPTCSWGRARDVVGTAQICDAIEH